MSEIENLIDLSLEETIENNDKENHQSAKLIFDNIQSFQTTSVEGLNNLLYGNVEEGRPSLDNNPFDRAQKLASRAMDPFEIVEREACMKARQSAGPLMEVRLGNLLSLSDENIARFDENYINQEKFKRDDKVVCGKTPVNLLEASGNSSSSASDSGGGSKSKKIDVRNRLLKFSLTNSSFSSPVNRKLLFDRQEEEEEGGVLTPLSKAFAEAGAIGDIKLSAESPLKFVDDDLMMEEPPSLMESDFDADLEMLRIPMLKDLCSHTKDKKLNEFEKDQKCTTYVEESKNVYNSPKCTPLSDLEALKAKLMLRKEEPNNNQDVAQLIESLKILINGISDENSERKKQAAALLETLSSTITPHCSENKIIQEETSRNSLTPQSLKRQGTFSLDLQIEEQDDEHPVPKANIVDSESIPNIGASSKISDIPECMFKSSATYDGDPVDEKRDYVLPIVEPLSPITIDEEPLSPIQPDLNDIAEQLGKLLEQHNFNQQMNNNMNASSGTSTMNPTFIVVMNTSTVGQLPNLTNRRNSYLLNESQSESLDSEQNPYGIRKRSQSLSIHDKVKIVNLPLQKSPKEKLSISSNQLEVPEHRTNTVIKSSSTMLSRRNSFSNASFLAASARKATEIRLADSAYQRNLVSQKNDVRQLPPLPSKRKIGNKSESIMKDKGPLKATIPIKRVAPTVKITSPVKEKHTFAPPQTPANKSYRPTNLSSSTQIVSKSGKMSITSTPMPRNGNIFNLSSANSSSMQALNVITPLKKSSTSTEIPGKSSVKSRYSVTPNTKTSAPFTAASGLKRRSLNALTTKSPAKPRQSSATLNALATKSPVKPRQNTPNDFNLTASPRNKTASNSTKSKLPAITSRSSSRFTLRSKNNI